MTLRTKTEIQDLIDAQLAWDSRVNADDINIAVDDGMVILTGTVPSYSAHRAAAEDASSVLGVTDVDNRLMVAYPPAMALPSDLDIKSRLNSTLLWDSVLNSDNFDIGVTDGWVTLGGTTDAYWKKLRAENLAANVNGVLGVTNEIAVVPTEDIADEATAKDIMDALHRDRSIDADRINVKVADGHVTLTGFVPTPHAYQRAYDLARYTFGVIDVDNNLVLE